MAMVRYPEGAKSDMARPKGPNKVECDYFKAPVKKSQFTTLTKSPFGARVSRKQAHTSVADLMRASECQLHLCTSSSTEQKQRAEGYGNKGTSEVCRGTGTAWRRNPISTERLPLRLEFRSRLELEIREPASLSRAT